jgi:hypothetical protein
MDVNLLTIHPDGSVDFSLSRTGGPISGLDALFQKIVLKIMKTPGTDVLAPGDGGGLQELFLGNMGTNDELTAEVAEIIRRTREGIVSDQLTQNIPDDERLRTLTIQRVIADRETSTLQISIYFRNALQQSSTQTIVI